MPSRAWIDRRTDPAAGEGEGVHGRDDLAVPDAGGGGVVIFSVVA
jgi:hypothetical protein